MIDGRLTPKPVGKGCSFVGAPRNRSPQPTTGMVDPVQRLRIWTLKVSTRRFSSEHPRS